MPEQQPQDTNKKPGKGKKFLNGLGKGLEVTGRIVGAAINPMLGKAVEQGGKEIKSATDGDPNT